MTQPTVSDSGVAFRPGDFSTLCDALDYAATGNSGLNFYAADASLISSITYAELSARARDLADRMAGAFPRHARIGLVADTSEEFVLYFVACQYAGLIPAALSQPAAFGGREAYEWQAARMAETADLKAIFAPDNLRDILTSAMSGIGVPVFGFSGEDLAHNGAQAVRHGPDDPCYIQFSSGSTSAPKGIVAMQSSVADNCRGIIEGLGAVPGDRVVCWLPLYHDMGLVGSVLAPIYSQVAVDFLAPTAFARRPGTWLRIISRNGGTHSYSPSFGYDLCARRYRGEELDLSSWRVAGIGGDMVRSEALRAFGETFAQSGFRPSAFLASYGLAEATVAVSFAPLSHGMRLDRVDLAQMQACGHAVAHTGSDASGPARTFVSCGRPIASLEMRILDADERELGDREVGRIVVRGPSVAAGYSRAGEPLQPIANEAGWLETGDLGYWLDGEVYVTGRSKDLILWNGRNIWPQDIEWIAQRTGGKAITQAAAFDVPEEDGPGRIMLLAECQSRDAQIRAGLIRDITAAARTASGAPVNVELVKVRSLPMTSSGKLSRAATRASYLSGAFSDATAGDGRTSAAG